MVRVSADYLANFILGNVGGTEAIIPQYNYSCAGEATLHNMGECVNGIY